MASNRAAMAILDLGQAVTNAYFPLRSSADVALSEFGISASRLGILRTLDENGPLTVSDIARMRPVARQGVQVQVDAMLKDRLVRTVGNPQHRRSPLIELTPKARRLDSQIRKLQARFLADLSVDAPPAAEIRRAIGVLTWLREVLLDQASEHPS